jgi:small subunit ribosomal protein S5
VTFKYKSAIIKILPASSGTGLKAGSALRAVMELAGYTNILSKIMGTNNKLNNALAVIMALNTFKVDRSKLGTINLQEVMDTRKKEQAQAEADRAAKAERRPRRNANEQSGDASKKPAA